MSFGRVKVDTAPGSLTAWCEIASRAGLFGLSAYHVLVGHYDTLLDRERVQFFDRTIQDWIDIGNTYAGVYNDVPNSSSTQQFGKIDCGIFEVIPPIEKKIASRLRVIPVHPLIIQKNYRALVGLTVHSYSQVLKQDIKGIITKVLNTSPNGYRYDVIIDSVDSHVFTIRGDSGILWTDDKGNAIALHTNGNLDNATVSYSTLIDRVMKTLKIIKLYGIFSSSRVNAFSSDRKSFRRPKRKV